jgi:hypothetical protein
VAAAGAWLVLEEGVQVVVAAAEACKQVTANKAAHQQKIKVLRSNQSS